MLGRYEWREVVSPGQLGAAERSALLDHLAEYLCRAGATVERSERDAISFQDGEFSSWWVGELVREGELAVINTPECAVLLCRVNLCNFPLIATLLCLFLLPIMLLPVVSMGLPGLWISAFDLLVGWPVLAVGPARHGRYLVRRFLTKALADWRTTA